MFSRSQCFGVNIVLYQEAEEGEEEGDERVLLCQREEGGSLPGKLIGQLYLNLGV